MPRSTAAYCLHSKQSSQIALTNARILNTDTAALLLPQTVLLAVCAEGWQQLLAPEAPQQIKACAKALSDAKFCLEFALKVATLAAQLKVLDGPPQIIWLQHGPHARLLSTETKRCLPQLSPSRFWAPHREH